MYFCYIDECGTKENPNVQSKASSYYVLTGLCIHETNWVELEKDVNLIKSKYFPNKNPFEFELHYYDLRNKKGVFKYFDDGESLSIANDVFDIINKHQIILFSVVIDKKNHFIRYKYPKPVDIFAFEMLLERFERFLRRENEKKSPKNCGCLIFDSKTKWENAYLRRIYRALQSKGTSKLEIRNVIETVFFVPSEYSSGIQLADFCSYAVYFNFENLGEDKRPGRRFLQILPKFDKLDSKIVGLKIFP